MAIQSPSSDQRTVLVTGARTNKALAIARAFKRAGYRVILAEEREWGILACARFSRAADKYYNLPDPHADDEGQAYIDAIKSIIMRDSVHAWVPVSSVHATMIDSEAARQVHELELELHRGFGCDTFIQHPDIASTLHWKDRLGTLLEDLGYATPESRRVTTVAQAADFLHSPKTLAKGKKYLLKCLTLDDLARDDFTLLPLPTREETLAHLRNMPTPISTETPFLLQRFLTGKEYCVHVSARQGKITSFVACRSRELLMRYVDIRTLGPEENRRSVEIEQWIGGFLRKWRAKLGAESNGKSEWETELTGHFCFDFIKDDTDGILYPLECNVRAHTAVVLFAEACTLADSYLVVPSHDSPQSVPLSRPQSNSLPRSWIAHAFPLVLIASFLRLPFIRSISPELWGYIHPGLTDLCPSSAKLITNGDASSDSEPHGKQTQKEEDPTASPSPNDTPFSVLVKFILGTFMPTSFLVHINAKYSTGSPVSPMSVGMEWDPYWEWTDPLPFFILVHVTWVWMFVRLAWRGKKWRRVNVSTERVFEC
ncbi:hypothetical protein K474DRAFT_1669333 [Panus rudis PR-1116 ss-1]|nr:hypothetical protein K474DRAFT_1669333 [Panus rudis PR-1116 ss-1]